ncbi:aminodeoxychorismate/anthranilate synthase component II (plasmid) [Buchnera aphidicola (Kurisakia onigurumii)]|uniref:aminodeoxychorismate/anthranilate synthase component II n=1 Tax=Buchnera aphidicola TaxID=9 RepID=UPI0031B6FE13
MTNIIVLDNFDSFIYNLVDHLRYKNHQVNIYRNDIKPNIIIEHLLHLKNSILILSPGPGTPKNSGYMMNILKEIKGKIPVIGICLGFQAIIELYGGKIGLSKEILHGKKSLIYHDEKDMFQNIPNPFFAARYHSLVGINIPNDLKINAHHSSLPMAIKNIQDVICGFQFHPESILTVEGTKILDQTLDWIKKIKRKKIKKSKN